VEELITVANRLSAAGLVTLLILVLFGNWMRIWRWGSDFTDLQTRYQKDREELIEEKNYWKHISERLIGLSETQGELLRVHDQINQANRGLLNREP
jgi:hypothetical protein